MNSLKVENNDGKYHEVVKVELEVVKVKLEVVMVKLEMDTHKDLALIVNIATQMEFAEVCKRL